MSYYPSHYAQLSPRDNYLAALARAKAAEEKYLAAEAIDWEERQIRRRLEELEFQKQKASHSHHPSYGAPDPLSVMRLQLQDEERQQAEVELFRRRKLQEETALAALQLDQERRERAQLDLLLEQRPTNHTSARKSVASGTYATIPAFKERYQARPSRHTHPAVAQPQHALPEPNPSSSNVDLEDVLRVLFGGKPSSSPRHYGASMRSPSKAERNPVEEPVDTVTAIEQTLKAIISDATIHFHDQPKAASSVQSAPIASSSKRVEKNSAPTAPTVEESASSSLPSPEAVIDLQQVLKHLFGGAVSLQEKSRSELQRPVTSLKEQLEARLASEETTEAKDTIQAIFNSLSDVSSPASSSAAPSTAEAATSSAKGKAKADHIPSNTDSHDLAVSLARVNSIETAYCSLVNEFTFPALLDFSPSPSPASSDTEPSLITRLAYTARNAPIRFHEQSLSGLLSQLDSIESFGDEGLRAKRKEVVGLVESALEDLEREVEGRRRVKVARDVKAESLHTGAPVAEPTPFSGGVVAVDHADPADPTEPTSSPAPAPILAVQAVSATEAPTSSPILEKQVASSPISAQFARAVEEPAKEALEESIVILADVSSDELSTESEIDSNVYEEAETAYLTSPNASSTASVDTVKPGIDGLTTPQPTKVAEERATDEGSDWSEVEG